MGKEAGLSEFKSLSCRGFYCEMKKESEDDMT